ncbi:MAG TPA: hypothetical protein VFG30_42560 [Polyangiales bacterium]|nr:hypothetical protein [Polyangiales bacterium]
METPELLFPHEANLKPLTAVRRMLVHSSITELEQLGYYERYCRIISPTSLAQIKELIGPGLMAVELALDHYRACDALDLTDEQIHAAGLRAGEKIGDALLVASAQVSASAEGAVWSVIGAFYRMSRRIYEGGSAQYVKLGPKSLLIEYKANPLFSVRYYRVAYAGFMRRTFGSVGLKIKDFTLSSYRREHAEIEVRMSWL